MEVGNKADLLEIGKAKKVESGKETGRGNVKVLSENDKTFRPLTRKRKLPEPQAYQPGRLEWRNLTPDAFKLALGRRYNRLKKANDGSRGNQHTGKDQIDPCPQSTAAKLAAEHSVSEATVKRAGKFAAEVAAKRQERRVERVCGEGGEVEADNP